MNAKLPAALAAALIAVAFGLALRAVRGLDWPCEIDFYRDLGGAQVILDGGFGSDPAYRGETNWYNPLQPATVAGLSAAAGVEPRVLYARAGPWLNLLGPVGFALLAARLLGPWPGAAALAAYLFLGDPAEPSFFQATYSPWAWPLNFAQGFFYLTVVAYATALTARRAAWDAATGVLLGLTFLAHTAPAMVFVGLILLLTALPGPEGRPRALRRLLLVGGISLLMSLPFLGPLAAAYGFRVRNHGPSEYAPIGVAFVLRGLIGVRPALAVVGLASLWGGADRRKAVLVGLFVSAAALFGYGMTAQLLQKWGIVNLPRVLPTYHFLVYLKAAESLLFGLGVAVAARRVGVRLTAGVTAVVVAAHLPGYLSGEDLVRFRRDGLAESANADRAALYGWLRSEAGPADVFLADPLLGVGAVAAANRKVVCMHDQYSNIYVDYDERFADLERMYAALRDRDAGAFDAAARRYGVTHVILADDAEPPMCRVPADRMDPARWRPVFDRGPCHVFRRVAAGPE